MAKAMGPKEAQRFALRTRKFGNNEAPAPRAQKLQEAKQAVESVSQKADVINASPKTEPPSPKSAYVRNARWRDKNREQYNESQKALMQRKAKSPAKVKGDR